MARNKIEDLKNHLFAQLEKLADEELTDEELKMELKRADGIVQLSQQIIDVGKMTLKAMELMPDGAKMASGFFTEAKQIGGSNE